MLAPKTKTERLYYLRGFMDGLRISADLIERTFVNEERTEQGCGTASGDAADKSKEPSASAEHDARRSTTTNDAALSEAPSETPSSKPQEPCSNEMDALAAAQKQKADGAALMVSVWARNRNGQCGICTDPKTLDWVSGAYQGEFVYFCSRECRAGFHRALQGREA